MRSARGFALVLVGALPVVAGATDARADLLSRAVAIVDDDPTGGGGAPGAAPTTVDDLSTWAGPARAVTLPDLLQQAVRQAPTLRTARIDITIAEAQIEQTYARDDWHVRAQLYGQSSSSFISGFAIDRSTTIGATADVSRLLPTGGTVTLHVGSQYSRSTSPINAADINTIWSDEVSLGIVQPLLRGRGRLLYEANERRATLSRDAAVLARRLAAIQAVQTVVSAYWDLVLAERQLAITQSSLDLAKERLRITTLGNQGGKIPRSEIPAVQQIIATREEDILTAELNVLERSIALRRTVGMPIGAGELGLRVTTDLATRDATWDLGQLTERAFAASPELAQLAKQDAVTRLDIEVTENGLLPQLDAALSVGPTGQDESFATAWTNLAKFKSIAIAGSLTYDHAIGQEDVRGRARELRANREKLEVNAFDIRAQIAQTMARAIAQLELARRRVGLSERAILLANENVKLETDRFNLGKSTNFDILGRLEEMRQAELRKSQAMIDWHKAESVVQSLTGDILPAYGIAVD
ncbi:MAG: TolC family protein [Deltaproteobacteria bacterium]|nr:TolC family protein [Deltaproteobacteria bacterium]